IALIGFVNAGIVVKEGGTILNLGILGSPGPMLTIIGLIITGFLLARKIKGALFFGILITTIIGLPMGVSYVPNGTFLKIFSAPPSIAPTFLQFEWSQIFTFDMLIVVF